MYITNNTTLGFIKVYNRLAIGYSIYKNSELQDKFDKYVSLDEMANNKTLIGTTLKSYTNQYNKASWEEVLLESMETFITKLQSQDVLVVTHDITYDIFRAILQYNTLTKTKFPFLIHNLITNLLLEDENPLSMDTYLRQRYGVDKFNSLNTLEGSPSTVCNLMFHTWNISKNNLG